MNARFSQLCRVLQGAGIMCTNARAHPKSHVLGGREAAYIIATAVPYSPGLPINLHRDMSTVTYARPYLCFTSFAPTLVLRLGGCNTTSQETPQQLSVYL